MQGEHKPMNITKPLNLVLVYFQNLQLRVMTSTWIIPMPYRPSQMCKS